MIRETKVGLVVTCSFLGLLGVVVTSKLNEKKANADTTGIAQTALSERETPSESKKGESETAPKQGEPKRLPPGVVQTKLEQEVPLPPETKETKPAPEPSVPLPPMTEPKAAEPPMVVADTKPVEPPPPAPMKEKTEPKKEIPSPIPPMTEKPPEPTPLPMPMVPLPPPAAEVMPPMVEPIKEKEPVAIPLPVPEPEKKEKTPELKLISTTPAVREGMKETPAPATPPAPSAIPESPPSAPMVEVPPVTVPPALPEGPKEKEEPKEPMKNVVPTPAVPMPIPPAMPETTPAVPVAPPMTTPEAPVGPIPIPTPAEAKIGGIETTPPPIAPAGPMPTPIITPTRPPVESPVPPVVARTEPRAPTTSEPPVDRFVEEDYKVKTGENFASISKNRYGSEEYAEALAQYNRNDALQGPPVLEKDGSLRPGQVVSLPDVNFLEKRYAKHVPHLKAPAKAVDTPSPMGVAPPAPAKGPTYKVPEKGQTMREIARLTLGEGERWKDIYHLNAQHRPDFAVPAGTVLTMPADAKVPQSPQ